MEKVDKTQVPQEAGDRGLTSADIEMLSRRESGLLSTVNFLTTKLLDPRFLSPSQKVSMADAIRSHLEPYTTEERKKPNIVIMTEHLEELARRLEKQFEAASQQKPW